MADSSIVNRLISVFGFEVDEAAKKKALQEVENFKKQLAGIEAKVRPGVQGVRGRAKKEATERLKVERETARKMGQIAYAERKRLYEKTKQLGKRVSSLKGAAGGTARRTPAGSIQSVIASTVGIHPSRLKATDTSYAASLKEQQAASKAQLLSLRNRIAGLGKIVQLNRRVNERARIKAQYDKEKLQAQHDLNAGLINQISYEQRINAIIDKRRFDSRRFREGRRAGGLGLAEAIGLSGAAGKIGKGLFPAAAAGGAAFGSVFAIQSLFGQANNIEKFRLAIGAIEGSAEKAQFELEHFRQVALTTNVSLDQGLDSYRKFFVSMRSAGQEADLTREVFDTMAKSSTVLGIGQDDTNGILRAFGQIAGKGKVMAEELTQQLGDRMPGALGLVAEGLGLTTSELYAQMAAGKVSAERFFPAMIKVMEKFASKSGEAANTLPGLWDSFLDTFKDISFALDEAGFTETLKEIMKNLTDFSRGFVKILAPVINSITVLLEMITNVFGTEGAGIIAGLFLVSVAIAKIMKAFIALHAVLAVSKLRAGIAAIFGIGAAGATSAAGVVALNNALFILMKKILLLAGPILFIYDLLDELFTGRKGILTMMAEGIFGEDVVNFMKNKGVFLTDQGLMFDKRDYVPQTPEQIAAEQQSKAMTGSSVNNQAPISVVNDFRNSSIANIDELAEKVGQRTEAALSDYQRQVTNSALSIPGP